MLKVIIPYVILTGLVVLNESSVDSAANNLTVFAHKAIKLVIRHIKSKNFTFPHCNSSKYYMKKKDQHFRTHKKSGHHYSVFFFFVIIANWVGPPLKQTGFGR